MTISTSRNKIWRGTDWCSMHLVWYYVIYHIKKRCSNVLRLMSCGTHPYCVYERRNKLQGVAGLFFFFYVLVQFPCQSQQKATKNTGNHSILLVLGPIQRQTKNCKRRIAFLFSKHICYICHMRRQQKICQPPTKMAKKKQQICLKFFWGP